MQTRRSALKQLAAAGTALAMPSTAPASEPPIVHGRIQQSIVPWCFKPMTVPELAEHAAAMKFRSVELCPPEHWPRLKELGLTCAIASSHGFARGFAQPDQHDECIALLRERIEQCAAHGVERVITFSGFRKGLSDEVAMKNTVAGLKKILPFAEEKKVTLCLEMLNSRVNIEMKGHPDYFCDDLERSVEICRQIGSERMKVLFDIYHVQIMHGDIITRLRQHFPYIAHVHTAGVPGRGEIDDTQEINYRPLMQTLVELGYRGYVGQEFIPVRDKVASLREAAVLCDV
jgi:hydroxypyruvate isomerase